MPSVGPDDSLNRSTGTPAGATLPPMRVERWHPTMCRECRRKETKRTPISKRGLCRKCALNRVGDSHSQLRNREGPMYDKWVRRTARGQQAWMERSQA